jgi:hypothetical protein
MLTRDSTPHEYDHAAAKLETVPVDQELRFLRGAAVWNFLPAFRRRSVS